MADNENNDRGAHKALDLYRRLWKPSAPGFFLELSRAEKAVLSTLLSHADARGQCWPSLSTLAAGSRLSRAAVAHVLKNLEGRGKTRRIRPPLIQRTRREAPLSTMYTLSLLNSPATGLVQPLDHPSPATGPEIVQPLDPNCPLELPTELPTEAECRIQRGSTSAPPSLIADREEFWEAIFNRDARGLDRLVGNMLYGFGQKAAEWVVGIPKDLLNALEASGLEAEAEAVGARGCEDEVVADALRDLIRKSKTGKWDRKVFNHFLVAACRVRVAE